MIPSTSDDGVTVLIPVFNDWDAVGLLLAQLDRELARLGASLSAGRATLAWLLKYGLLHLARSAEAPDEPEAPQEN